MTEVEIERIVQEVVRRLLSMGARITRGAVSASDTESANVSRTLELNERVISLRTLEGQLDGIQQLVVPAKAVITPSVRDELRQKKIELVRQ